MNTVCVHILILLAWVMWAGTIQNIQSEKKLLEFAIVPNALVNSTMNKVLHIVLSNLFDKSCAQIQKMEIKLHCLRLSLSNFIQSQTKHCQHFLFKLFVGFFAWPLPWDGDL